MTHALATCLGMPRIGVARELKKSLEAYWAKTISADALDATGREVRTRNARAMAAAGIQPIPCNDFSFYDHMLDTAVLLGAVPARYRVLPSARERYFAMARGFQQAGGGVDLAALEMTKWFDTNYHYIVPELEAEQTFTLDASKIMNELEEVRALGLEARPVLVGPVTFLLLSKYAHGQTSESRSTLELLDEVLPVYAQLLGELEARGVAWVQLDEPCLVLELDAAARSAYEHAFASIATLSARPKVMVTTYFGALVENLPLATESRLEGLHVDLVRAPEQLEVTVDALLHEVATKADMRLSLGLVDGRNVWRTDLDSAYELARYAITRLGAGRVVLAPSCSLLHVPVDLAAEQELDVELQSWLAFAMQKLGEVRALADAAVLSDVPADGLFLENRTALEARAASARVRSERVRDRMQRVDASMRERHSVFAARKKVQHARFKLPAFPTTTIGSFPQTNAVRAARAAWRSGKLAPGAYEEFLRGETQRCVQKQEAIGLDVLVHGEFERTDMVEYFGEKLDGFAFTENGWVQSYGSRCVKPPLLFGDVWRASAMTVRWSQYAQSLTSRPMKGMLTGPVTILQWSFVRNDQPRSETCAQIALALRDEVTDLEAAGISMIQVDEPAIREGLPLRKSEWPAYLTWAVDAFLLATTGVADTTQIHTHMCYSEFGDILAAIAALDADVLSVETSRSQMELLHDFARFRYPNEIGPGVYDIHSPRVPSRQEMLDLLGHAVRVLPADQLWVNPDCGLKTRGWPEVEAALTDMVAAAKAARETLGAP